MSQSRLLSIISTLVIHCSATQNGQLCIASDIDYWHQRRGFSRSAGFISQDYPLHCIGYHYVITLDGTVERGRRPDEVGAHVQGFNTNSLGICLIGTDKFTPAQWQALRDLVGTLVNKYRITTITGHRDLSPDSNGDGKVTANEWLKTCPGFDVTEWLRVGRTPLTAHTLLERAGYPDAEATVTAEPPSAAPVALVSELLDISKPWWQSKTIQGAVIAALPALAHAAGIDYTVLSPYAGDIATLAGAIFAIIGRKMAVATLR